MVVRDTPTSILGCPIPKMPPAEFGGSQAPVEKLMLFQWHVWKGGVFSLVPLVVRSFTRGKSGGFGSKFVPGQRFGPPKTEATKALLCYELTNLDYPTATKPAF